MTKRFGFHEDFQSKSTAAASPKNYDRVTFRRRTRHVSFPSDPHISALRFQTCIVHSMWHQTNPRMGVGRHLKHRDGLNSELALDSHAAVTNRAKPHMQFVNHILNRFEHRRIAGTTAGGLLFCPAHSAWSHVGVAQIAPRSPASVRVLLSFVFAQTCVRSYFVQRWAVSSSPCACVALKM